VEAAGPASESTPSAGADCRERAHQTAAWWCTKRLHSVSPGGRRYGGAATDELRLGSYRRFRCPLVRVADRSR